MAGTASTASTRTAAPSSSRTRASCRRRASPAGSTCCAWRRRSAPRAPRPAALRTWPWILPSRCAGRCRSCASIASAGWIELLYKVHGHGLEHLAARRTGDIVNLLGPIGQGFTPHAERPRALLIGGGVGIPPMVFLAETLRDRAAEGFRPFAILGSELPFPFRARPSTIMVPGMPDGVIACMPLLDEWGVPSRLTTQVRLSRLPRRLRHRPGAPVAGAARCRSARRRWRCSPAARRRCCAPSRRWRANSTCPARSRWRNSWPAPWAAAPAARSRCSTPTGPAMKRVCVDGPGVRRPHGVLSHG